MAKEHFPELYSMLELIVKSKNDTVDVIIERLARDFSGKSLRSQAEKVMELMDAYEEPTLPFADVTSEQITEKQQHMNDRYGFVVWSNRTAGTDEDCADLVKNDPDYYLGMSEDVVRQISYEACMEEQDILKNEFDSIGVNKVLIFGIIGRWDGAKAAFKVADKLRDVFRVFTDNYATLYIKNGELRAENVHHDGTDSFIIRTFKEDVDPDEFYRLDSDTIEADTESLVPVLNKHFGWKQLLETDEQADEESLKAMLKKLC